MTFLTLVADNTNKSAVETMSSLEIAEITGKEHGHVLRDFREMVSQLTTDQNPELDSKQYQILTLSNGMTKEILMDKELTFTLVSGYNVKLRNAIVKRWQELEESAKKPALPATYLEALEALVASEKEKLALAATASNLQIELDQSKQWLTIKRVAQHNGIDWRSLSWRKLKAASLVVEQPTRKIFDANYGEVNTYHADAWRVVYPELDIPKV